MAKIYCTDTPKLYQIEGQYYYRLQITKKMLPGVGPREIRRSLQTIDLTIARFRCAHIDLLIRNLMGKIKHMLRHQLHPKNFTHDR